MKGIATSDLHLGFRAFPRYENGRPAREQDVERAWSAVVDTVVLRQPHLVTIAGDVFHNGRPSFFAVEALQAGIRRIVRETQAIVVIIGGNHESPKTAESQTPNIVVEGEGFGRVYVVTQPERLTFTVASGEIVSVACFPFQVLGQPMTFLPEPSPEADVNVLLVHAAVKTSADGADSLPYFYGNEAVVDIAEFAEMFDVIALGDYHEFRALQPSARAFYSGSIERTSSNIWDETAPKVIVEYDTDSPDLILLDVPTRHLFDYDLDDVLGGQQRIIVPDAAAVNKALAEILAHGAMRDAIVRLKVNDFPRSQREGIDQALIGELRNYCFHFYLDVRYSMAEALEYSDRRHRAGRTLADEAIEFFREDRQEVQELADHYLSTAYAGGAQ